MMFACPIKQMRTFLLVVLRSDGVFCKRGHEILTWRICFDMFPLPSGFTAISTKTNKNVQGSEGVKQVELVQLRPNKPNIWPCQLRLVAVSLNKAKHVQTSQ